MAASARCVVPLKHRLRRPTSHSPGFPPPSAQAVVQTLIKHGRQTFQELRFLSKLPPDAVRTALVVLIQQNCVAVYLHVSEAERRTEQIYEADIPRMCQIMRMPRFTEHVRQHYAASSWGPAAMAVVQTLLHHGRLRLSQLPLAVRSVRAATGQEGDEAPEALLAAVKALVAGRLLERVPPCTLPPPPPRVHIDLSKKKKTQPKPGSEEEAAAFIEAAKAKLRHDFLAMRFVIPPGEATLDTFTAPPAPAEAGDGDGAGGAAGGKRKRGGGAAASPAKRGRVEVKAEDGGALVAAGAGEAIVLWRVNYEELNRRFRNVHIAEALAAQYSGQHPATAAVAQAWLAVAAGRESEDVGERWSGAASADEITRESRRLHGPTDAVPHDTVVRLLDALVAAEAAAEEIAPGGTAYRLDLHVALGNVRQAQVLAVVGRRFGDTARRIWHMLRLEGQLEQKAVAEKAMVPNAEAREALYAMLRDGYLGLQDIPRNNDRAPSKTFYTWRADLGSASSRLATQLYRTAGNLLARLTRETEARAALTEMIELVGQGRLEPEQLDGRAVAGFRAVVRTLQTALVRLDLQMTVFSDM
jgi:DNA-directed RNA polymerase III subunit RPC3